MCKIKEVLRLRFELGLGQRDCVRRFQPWSSYQLTGAAVGFSSAGLQLIPSDAIAAIGAPRTPSRFSPRCV